MSVPADDDDGDHDGDDDCDDDAGIAMESVRPAGDEDELRLLCVWAWRRMNPSITRIGFSELGGHVHNMSEALAGEAKGGEAHLMKNMDVC